MTENPSDAVSTKIHHETAKIPWRELQRFFAAGKAVFVDPSLDLIQIATYFAEDKSAAIEMLMEKRQISLVSDTQALDWHEKDLSTWAVVISPWVLVQPVQ